MASASRDLECRVGITRSASQGIIITLIEAIDFLAVEALVSDLHPRAERAD
jgi:hypothetical protein